MGEPALKTRCSYEDYLALERETDIRHEWLDGEVWAMAGGTPVHSRIKTNLTGFFHMALRRSSCVPYDSDLKVRTLDTDLATYPDLTVVCGPIALHPGDKNAVTNPTVLVEVLSPSTERWDRGAKFAHYRRIPSLQHVLFVDPEAQRVEVYTRGDGATWTLLEGRAGASLGLSALGIDIAVDELFLGLPEEAPGEAGTTTGPANRV